MFNWTTTNLINEMPFIKKDNGKLRIGKYLFEKRWVESIKKAEGHKAEICSVSLDLSKVKTALDNADVNTARLYIYVGLEGSEESIYANDWYRKGMPLSVSFVNDTAENMAKAIVDTVKRFNIFTKVKKVLEVEANGTTLVIKGTHEYQRLQKVRVLIEKGYGEEQAIVDYELNHKSDEAIIDEVKGVNGFGTYSQLIKDLRLPTAPNNYWLSTNKNEMPIVGSLYTQYIINYYAPSTANPSFTAIGNRSMSETTHVFWIKNDLITDWENALAEIDPDAEGLNTETPVEGKKMYNNKKQSLVERVEALEN